MKILVTGGAGFIGSNFVRHHLKNNPNDEIIVLDKLTYAGRLENLKELENNPNFKLVKGDICNEELITKLINAERIEQIINFAAESHVDNSIIGPKPFIETNVSGTFNLLECTRKAGNQVKLFVQISTDEVYGSIENGSFFEESSLQPNSPYSASKASADLIARSYYITFGLPIIITRTCNNFGPFHFPEKLFPLFITNLIEGKPVPVYGDGKNVREWIYVEDNCNAIDFIIKNGKFGEIYNIGSENERNNLEVTKFILKELKKDETFIQFVEDRKGHDRRYSINFDKLKKMGWKPKHNFEDALRKTIQWYKENEWWWKPLKNYQNYSKSPIF